MTELVVKQCRICFTTEDLESIDKVVKIDDEKMQVSSILTDLIRLVVSDQDGLPPFMCLSCLEQLLRSFMFKQQCLKAYEVSSAHSRLTAVAELPETPAKEDETETAEDESERVCYTSERVDLTAESEEETESRTRQQKRRSALGTRKVKVKILSCDLCRKHFVSDEALELHLSSNHNVKVEDNDDEDRGSH